MNCRISPVSDDWAVKGCHAHFGRTEFAIRPDHLGGFVCRKVFSSTTDEELPEAEKAFELSMRDRDWRRKLREAVARGMKDLQGLCRGNAVGKNEWKTPRTENAPRGLGTTGAR